MFQNGDRVVLGVSGGADSICLLFVLLRLRESLGIELCVVHVNHGVRQDAGEDAAYVESLCRQFQLPFLLEEISMAELAASLGVSQEEAGRIARYEAFEKACERYHCNKIAVAHNSNDRAETMLFHLFRGTGLKGMAGILPVRDNVVRPILCLERDEIEEYLKVRGILYKQDSTNDTDDYTRNRIRHHILAYTKEHIAAGCVSNMCRAGEIFAEEEGYLEAQTLEALGVCMVSGDGDSEGGGSKGEKDPSVDPTDSMVVELWVEAFLKQHPVIRKRLLLSVLRRLSPMRQDITAVHIGDILTLFEMPGNRQIHLPYQIRGQRIYDKVRLERRSGELWERSGITGRGGSGAGNGVGRQAGMSACGFDIQIPQLDNAGDEHTVWLPDGTKMIFTVTEAPQNLLENQGFFENICKNRYTKWFDYDTIIKPLRVRTRQTGDYLTIRGRAGLCHKKLKDYMVTEKIPQDTRDEIPVIAEEDHVLWLAGYRISEHYKVAINTKRILQVRWVR